MNASKKGNTLIELLAVMALIGIVGAMTRINGAGFWGDSKLRCATKGLISDLRYAKTLAIAMPDSSIRVTFFYDSLKDGYTGYKVTDELVNHQKTFRTVYFDDSVSIKAQLSTFDFNRKQIGFLSNGSASPACTIVLYDSARNKTAKITLSIGFTRIMEVEGI